MSAYIKFVKFCQFILKILSGKKFWLKSRDHNSGTNVGKMMCNNHNVDLINLEIQNLVKFYHFDLKILTVNKILNEILTSIMGHNSKWVKNDV